MFCWRIRRLLPGTGYEGGAQTRKLYLLALNIMQGEFLLDNFFCIFSFQDSVRWTWPGAWDWCKACWWYFRWIYVFVRKIHCQCYFLIICSRSLILIFPHFLILVSNKVLAWSNNQLNKKKWEWGGWPQLACSSFWVSICLHTTIQNPR